MRNKLTVIIILSVFLSGFILINSLSVSNSLGNNSCSDSTSSSNSFPIVKQFIATSSSLNYTYSVASTLGISSSTIFQDAFFKDDYMFVLRGEMITTVQITDILNPIIRWNRDGVFDALNIAYSNGHIIVPCGTTLKTYTVSDYRVRFAKSYMYISHYLTDAITIGTTALLTGYDGVQIYDIANLPSCSLDNSLDFETQQAQPANMAIGSNNTLFIAREQYGISVIDASNIYMPKEVAILDRPGIATNVVYNDSLFFVAEFDEGFSIFNASNPSLPEVVNSYYGVGHVRDVCISGDKIYTANGLDGIEIIDGRNLTDLKQLLHINVGKNIHRIYVRNETIYAFDAVGGGMYILSIDSDMDGLTDLEEENETYTDPLEIDTDFDGLTDFQEIRQYLTDPLDNDSDADGYLDGEEILNGWDPLNLWDPLGVGVDSDEDGLSDNEEYLLGTDIYNNDTDYDYVLDGDEVHLYLTDPFDNDTDHDGLIDSLEIFVYFTNPLNKDSDGEGLSDSKEILVYLTDPLDIDTDGDSYNDYIEIFVYYTDPLNKFSNIRVQDFFRTTLPRIAVSLVVLAVGIFFTIQFVQRIRSSKLDKKLEEIDCLLSNQVGCWLRKLDISLDFLVEHYSGINSLASFLLSAYTAKNKFPTKKQVEKFLAKNSLTSLHLQIVLKLLTDNFKIDHYLLTSSDYILLDRLTVNLMQQLPGGFPKKKVPINIPLLLPNSNSSLLNTIVLTRFIQDCLLSVKLPQSLVALIATSDFDKVGCLAIRAIWREKLLNLENSVQLLWLVKELNIGILKAKALLLDLAELDENTLIEKLDFTSTDKSQSLENNAIGVDNSFSNYSSLLREYWIEHRKTVLEYGEIAHLLHLDSLRRINEIYNFFYQELIIEKPELFVGREVISLAYTPTFLLQIIEKARSLAKDQTFTQKVRKYLSSLRKTLLSSKDLENENKRDNKQE